MAQRGVAAVSFARRGQEMTPSFWVLLRIAVINSAMSDPREKLSVHNREECFEVASVEWLLLPGR